MYIPLFRITETEDIFLELKEFNFDTTFDFLKHENPLLPFLLIFDSSLVKNNVDINQLIRFQNLLNKKSVPKKYLF